MVFCESDAAVNLPDLSIGATLAASSVFFTLWRKVRRLFKPKRRLHENGEPEDTDSSSDLDNKDSSCVTATFVNNDQNMNVRGAVGREFLGNFDIEGFVDDLDETSDVVHYAQPAWLEGPRDATTLPAIIQSTYSPNLDEAEYAMKQMLAILETLDPAFNIELFADSFRSIANRMPRVVRHPENGVSWEEVVAQVGHTPQRLTANMTANIFDSLPYLFEVVDCHPQLEEFRDTLSLFLVIPLCTHQNFQHARRQAISAVSILIERHLLSQDVLREVIVPSLFSIYEDNGPAGFTTNDQKLEAISSLTQSIVWEAISDRDWIFNNFLPRYSYILSDSVIHARKNALSIFGGLAKMFGQQFTEAFLVPHLIALCDDGNWAVRKAVCEVFVDVAECTSRNVRAKVLASHFVKLLNDPSKWVSFVAFQQLGPLIATFANSSVTGLELRDGQIHATKLRAGLPNTSLSAPATPTPTSTPNSKQQQPSPKTNDEPKEDLSKYGNLPENVYLPHVESCAATPEVVRRRQMNLTNSESKADDVSRRSENRATSSTSAQSNKKSEGSSGEESLTTPLFGSVLSGLNKVIHTFDGKSSSPSNVARAASSRVKSIFSTDVVRRRVDFFGSSGTTSVASLCKSREDLSTLCFDDDFSSSHGNDNENSDDEDDLNASFVGGGERESAPDEEMQTASEEESGRKSESVAPGASSTGEKENSPNGSTTNYVSYWDACDIDIDTDELMPFGAGSPKSPSINFLEDRLDVMRSRSRSFGSPATSPRKHTTGAGILFSSPIREYESPSPSRSPISPMGSFMKADMSTSSSEESDMNRTINLFDVPVTDMDVDDELNQTTSTDIQMDETMDSQYFDEDIEMEDVQQKARLSITHVPSDLVESFMKIIDPVDNYESDIFRHCAHNFPAVAYTLGRGAWPRLKDVYERLAFDEQIRVRASMAQAIHEIAFIVGPEIADKDLLPIFCTLRNDDAIDVRTGILKHLYEFVKCLSVTKRKEMIESLPTFFPVSTTAIQNGDWRSRFELISQLAQLCSLYDVFDINEHMSGIALTLANDRVAEVRREAVVLVARIVGALVAYEWPKISADEKTLDEAAPLTTQFVRDIVNGFAKTQKWTRRQTFAFICAQVVKDRMCSIKQFRWFFLPHLEAIVKDEVANVRLAACEAMLAWKECLESGEMTDIENGIRNLPGEGPINDENTNLHKNAAEQMEHLTKDDDVDVAYFAQRAARQVSDRDPIDIVTRTERMHRREEEHFGDRVVIENGKCLRMKNGTEVVTEGSVSSISVVSAPLADGEMDITPEAVNKSDDFTPMDIEEDEPKQNIFPESMSSVGTSVDNEQQPSTSQAPSQENVNEITLTASDLEKVSTVVDMSNVIETEKMDPLGVEQNANESEA